MACTLLGARHEANVIHVRDAASGELRHAQALVGAHTGDHSDIHARTEAADADECAILTALHQAASSATSPVLVAAPVAAPATVSVFTPLLRRERQSVYRLAPKTSPPAHA